MKEQWNEIKGCLGYSISNLGRIRSNARWITNCNGVRRFWPERILKATPGGNGYLCIVLGGKNRRNRWVHKMVAEAFIPNPENKKCVNHKGKDGDKTNNKVSNLEWATHKENMQHAIDSGFLKNTTGSGNWNAKLNEDKVKEILKELKQGTPQSKIAKKWGVSQGSIGQINTGATWKHVPRI